MKFLFLPSPIYNSFEKCQISCFHSSWIVSWMIVQFGLFELLSISSLIFDLLDRFENPRYGYTEQFESYCFILSIFLVWSFINLFSALEIFVCYRLFK